MGGKIIVNAFIAMVLIWCLMQYGFAEEMEKKGLQNEMTLYNFEDKEEISWWRVVNDGVMGGLSQSEIIWNKSNTALFKGNVSLENNGGFSSTRTRPRDYDIADHSGITVRVKGDGKKYQFRVRTDDRFDGISYRFHFPTITDEWTEVQVAFKDLVPVFRGRIVTSAKVIEPKKIQQIGFLIADNQSGPFHLEIDWIKLF